MSFGPLEPLEMLGANPHHPSSLVKFFPQTWKLIFLIKVGPQIGVIEYSGYSVFSKQINIVGIGVQMDHPNVGATWTFSCLEISSSLDESTLDPWS